MSDHSTGLQGRLIRLRQQIGHLRRWTVVLWVANAVALTVLVLLTDHRAFLF